MTRPDSEGGHHDAHPGDTEGHHEGEETRPPRDPDAPALGAVEPDDQPEEPPEPNEPA